MAPIARDGGGTLKTWLVRLGIALVAVLALVVALVVVLNLVSHSRQQKTYRLEVPPIAVPTDSSTLARGQHLVTTVGACAECHGSDLGGSILFDSPVMGRLSASNLTSGHGGAGRVYSNEDFVRALRHGVGRDAKSLVFMPSEGYQAFTDEDLGAVIAYLRSRPPVDRTLPSRNIGPLARVLHILGLPLLPAEKIDHRRTGSGAIPGASAEYGEYLATVSGCRGCHGPALAGGGGGPGPNITRGALASWGENDFGRAVREGKRPDGTAISTEMPWKAYARFTDEEIRALWMYVLSVPEVKPKGK